MGSQGVWRGDLCLPRIGEGFSKATIFSSGHEARCQMFLSTEMRHGKENLIKDGFQKQQSVLGQELRRQVELARAGGTGQGGVEGLAALKAQECRSVLYPGGGGRRRSRWERQS